MACAPTAISSGRRLQSEHTGKAAGEKILAGLFSLVTGEQTTDRETRRQDEDELKLVGWFVDCIGV